MQMPRHHPQRLFRRWSFRKFMRLLFHDCGQWLSGLGLKEEGFSISSLPSSLISPKGKPGMGAAGPGFCVNLSSGSGLAAVEMAGWWVGLQLSLLFLFACSGLPLCQGRQTLSRSPSFDAALAESAFHLPLEGSRTGKLS